ncbi:MAG: phosphatidate cytidylyltransferase [Clostridiales bacterium]|nr:phosphatidate cytidylyltransferase [Clostridiales bacterium]
MAQRVIVGIALGLFGILCLYLDNFFIYLAIVIVISVLATYELFFATKYLKNKLLSFVSLVFVMLTPIIYNSPIKEYYREIYLGYILILFVIMLFKHERIKFEQLALVAFIAFAIPMSMSCNLGIRFDNFNEKSIHGLFFLFVALISAFIGDTGAYFVGTFFGKHKLAPKISPNKTIEGFFGGILTVGVVTFLYSYSYQLYLDKLYPEQYEVNLILITLMSIVAATLGVLGDLSASLIKRECSVKDFGNIMPGHGGILDRFDSLMFISPFVYQIVDRFSDILIKALG